MSLVMTCSSLDMSLLMSCTSLSMSLEMTRTSLVMSLEMTCATLWSLASDDVPVYTGTVLCFLTFLMTSHDGLYLSDASLHTFCTLSGHLTFAVAGTIRDNGNVGIVTRLRCQTFWSPGIVCQTPSICSLSCLSCLLLSPPSPFSFLSSDSFAVISLSGACLLATLTPTRLNLS